MKNKSNDSNTNKSTSEVSLTSGTSITLERGSFIDLSEASLSLGGAILGISLDSETSTDIKIEAE